MTTARYWTAQAIIDQAAIELGLAAPGAGLYASTDSNVVLLRSLLNTAGQELALMAEWPALVNEHTVTSTGAGAYALPADFAGILDETAWDRDQVYPMAPVSPQDWQYDQAAGTSTTWNDLRIVGDQFKVQPDDGVGNTIAFEYRSRYWVKPAAQSAPTAATATAADDVVYFEPIMCVALVKCRFQQARGFDSTGSLVEFERRFDAALNAQIAAPVLHLGRGRV